MKQSQTRTAVLGALSVEPMTGYALREAIRDVLGHFWSESFGQIYPTLAALQSEGLIRRAGSGQRGSSTFTITPSGQTRLRALLAEPIQRQPPRNALLLRLFFGRHLGQQACESLVREARADAERQLTEMAAIRAELASDESNAEDQPYWLLTVSAGEHAARAAIAWADETIAALRESSTAAEEEHRP